MNWEIANENERIADCENDFYTLTSPSGNLEFPIKVGLRRALWRGADSAAYKVVDAYGYDSETGAESIKGMLGVFVYNADNARTVFLPLGKSGHGRRKGIVNWNPSPMDTPGTMRYSSRSAYTTAFTKTPYVCGSLSSPRCAVLV